MSWKFPKILIYQEQNSHVKKYCILRYTFQNKFWQTRYEYFKNEKWMIFFNKREEAEKYLEEYLNKKIR